jgi:hypothetical protein
MSTHTARPLTHRPRRSLKRSVLCQIANTHEKTDEWACVEIMGDASLP